MERGILHNISWEIFALSICYLVSLGFLPPWEEIMWAMLATKRHTVYKVLTFSNSTNNLGIICSCSLTDIGLWWYQWVAGYQGALLTPKSPSLSAVLVGIPTVGFWLGLLWVTWWRKELGPDLSLSLLTTSRKPSHPGHSFYPVKVLTAKGQLNLSSEF